MRIVAIVNQKGGCGKTTTAINLAAVLARRGLRTLIVDMDPQSHCAAGLGVPESNIEFSIADALILGRSRPLETSGLLWEVSANLDLAPSTIRLAGLEAPQGGLHELPDKDRRLSLVLDQFRDRYDYCLIDCPPTLGLLTFNALRAAREALIPVETGFFAFRGAEKQWGTIRRLIDRLGRPINCHIVPTLYDETSQLGRDILASLRQQFAEHVAPAIIRQDQALREAASFGQPVIEFAPESNASRDYQALADWLESNPPRREASVEVTQPGVPPATRPGPRPAPTRMPVEMAMMSALGATTTPGAGGRAAELARRVRDLALLQIDAASESPAAAPMAPAGETPRVGAPVTTVEEDDEPRMEAESLAARLALLTMSPSTAAPPPIPARTAPVSVPYGVRATRGGMLFTQPGTIGRVVSIAGEFNQWSATATPMRLNVSANVFEALVPIPPGTYQYRLVVDGRWQADPHNVADRTNAYGEPNSVLTVRAAER